MSKVRIVTDSPADIPPALAKELDITVVPLTVHFGEKTYRDGIDLNPSQFYDLLEKSTVSPTTSQPSPGVFAEEYKRLTADGSAVVSIHLSSKLSGTYQAAVLGKSMVEGASIEVIDSRLASVVYGWVVLEAARAAKAGKSASEVVAHARDLLTRMRVVFAVDTLEYLARNGRIGRAQAFLGTMLAVKPLLTLEDGVVAPVEKVRGERRVIPRMVELIAEMLEPGGPRALVIGHAKCPERAAELADAAKAAFGVNDVLLSEIGSVIGTHVGPGTLHLTAVKQ